jgi:hypothetical protein
VGASWGRRPLGIGAAGAFRGAGRVNLLLDSCIVHVGPSTGHLLSRVDLRNRARAPKTGSLRLIHPPIRCTERLTGGVCRGHGCGCPPCPGPLSLTVVMACVCRRPKPYEGEGDRSLSPQKSHSRLPRFAWEALSTGQTSLPLEGGSEFAANEVEGIPGNSGSPGAGLPGRHSRQGSERGDSAHDGIPPDGASLDGRRDRKSVP